MTPLKSAILCATLAPCLAFAAGSEHDRGMGSEQGKQGDRQQAQLDTTEDGFLRSAPQRGVSVDNLIGSNVVSRVDGEEIGSVEDILIDQDGNPLGVIVSVGGFLGMGSKKVALEWDSVTLTPEDDDGILGGGAGDTDRAQGQAAPGAARDGATATDRGVGDRDTEGGVGAREGLGQDRDDDDHTGQARAGANPDDYKVMVNTSKEALENAPEFDRNW